jgi:hypothetical protein
VPPTFKGFTACSLGLAATSQQYFSLRTNQQYFSPRTISTSHQPNEQTVILCSTPAAVLILKRLYLSEQSAPATSQTNRLLFCAQLQQQSQFSRDFYLYAIKKDGADLCVTKKVIRTCVPST